jgi:hypothetical protein
MDKSFCFICSVIIPVIFDPICRVLRKANGRLLLPDDVYVITVQYNHWAVFYL